MTINKPVYEDDVFEISHLICQKVLNILKIGHGVIVDHVITSERIYKQLTETLKEYALIMVQVTCPLNGLEKREKSAKTDILVRQKLHVSTFILKGDMI